MKPLDLTMLNYQKLAEACTELISPHHLRNVLNLKDGDMVEFTLASANLPP
jgi:CTP-dependent riboflavin kinase